jgi:hypothetical protein
MPSQRSRGFDFDEDAYNSQEDPDYYPSDASDDSSVQPPLNDLDRCQYIALYEQELQQLYTSVFDQGGELMGAAFLQSCSFTTFANFCYRHTLP